MGRRRCRCGKTASYGFDKRSDWVCHAHRAPGMINMTRRRTTCVGDDGRCQVRPSYGPEGTRKRLYCRAHRPSGAVSIHNRTCIVCNRRAVNDPTWGLTMCQRHLDWDASIEWATT